LTCPVLAEKRVVKYVVEKNDMIDVGEITRLIDERVRLDMERERQNGPVSRACAARVAEEAIQKTLEVGLKFDRSKVGEYFAQFPEMWAVRDYENTLASVVRVALFYSVADQVKASVDAVVDEELAKPAEKQKLIHSPVSLQNPRADGDDIPY
jgi:hypothetical protein